MPLYWILFEPVGLTDNTRRCLYSLLRIQLYIVAGKGQNGHIDRLYACTFEERGWLKLILKIKQMIVAVQNDLTLRAVLGLRYLAKPGKDYLRLGTTWGGWWINSTFLNSAETKILISAGLGGDVSFEKEVSKKNFKLIGIDPDPKCHIFLKEIIPENIFEESITAAFSDVTGSKVLFKCDENSFDSWTDADISGDRKISMTFQSVGVLDLYNRLSIDENFKNTYLKMDIEGGELQVLASIIQEGLLFKYLSIEFDFLSLIPAVAINRRIKKIFVARRLLRNLELLNYEFLFHDGFNLYWALKE
jgi:FkbM family methyltransferase